MPGMKKKRSGVMSRPGGQVRFYLGKPLTDEHDDAKRREKGDTMLREFRGLKGSNNDINSLELLRLSGPKSILKATAMIEHTTEDWDQHFAIQGIMGQLMFAKIEKRMAHSKDGNKLALDQLDGCASETDKDSLATKSGNSALDDATKTERDSTEDEVDRKMQRYITDFESKCPLLAGIARDWKANMGTTSDRIARWEEFYGRDTDSQPEAKAKMVDVEMVNSGAFKLRVPEDMLFNCIRSKKQLKRDIKDFGPAEAHIETIRVNGGKPFDIESAAACNLRREACRVWRIEQEEARRREEEAEKAELKAEKEQRKSQQNLQRMKMTRREDGTVFIEPMGSDEEGNAVNVVVKRRQGMMAIIWKNFVGSLKDVAPTYSNV